MIAINKKDDFEDYWVTIPKNKLKKMILILRKKYPDRDKQIEKINTFLSKLTSK